MTPSLEFDNLRFAQRQRLTFIESVAFWEGEVDRPRVCKAFNVSENHVTKDFRLYKDAFPGNLQYDESSRVYRPTRRFKPRIGQGSAEEYLSMLRTYAESKHAAAITSLASAVAADVLPQPKGRVDASVLNAITRAITSGTGLSVTYQSQTRAQTTSRKIWPHALLFNGIRWHARVYDEQRGTFIDMVLQRIRSARQVDAPSPCEPDTDAGWTTFVTLNVIPSRLLAPSQAALVAQEFGMVAEGKSWVWKVKIRECLVGYFIYAHRLDLSTDLNRLIELADPSVVQRYLRSVTPDLGKQNSSGVVG
jgi:WYL domain